MWYFPGLDTPRDAWYIQNMASLQRLRVRGYTYWRIVESRRIGGRPRPVPVLHLGTPEQLLARLRAAAGGRLRVHSFRHGDVAALKAMADRLDVAALIDERVRRRGRRRRGSPSVGTTLVLAAINRAVQPRSKRGWASWAETTSVAHLFGVRCGQLTSQHFWEQMDAVGSEALERIEAELTRRVVELTGVRLDTLFYDTTNFFTYISSGNDRTELARRGHSKQHRSDLRQFSLALLVARDGQIPLCSHLYEGNVVDVTVFPQALSRIRRRLEELVGGLEELTLVFDKGNNSRANQVRVDEGPLHYVGSLVPSQQPGLMRIPRRDYTVLESGALRGLEVYRCQRQLWGQRRTVVMFLSERLRAGQIRGFNQQLSRRVRELTEWREALGKPRSGPRKLEALLERLRRLHSGQYLREVLKVDFDPRGSGSGRLRWRIDSRAVEHLHEEVFGKRILMTDRHEWSTEEIILAYRGQSRAEAAFRQLKNPYHLAVRPQYHWTDQKLRVHAFACLLGLVLARLVEWEARRAGWSGSLSGLLELLGSVRLAMALRTTGAAKGGRPRCGWLLERAEPAAMRMFRKLVPDEAPFVYTALPL